MKLRLLAAGILLAATATADAQRGDPLCEATHSCPYHRFCALAAEDYPPGTHLMVRCEWPYAANRGLHDYVMIDCPGGSGPAVIAHWRPYDPDCSHPFTNKAKR